MPAAARTTTPRWIAAGYAALLLALATAQTPRPSASDAPARCARPNVPASILRMVTPDMPAIAQQQGISGHVDVQVSLDADSHVTSAQIRSSPSAVLNSAALAAARASTYQTEIRDCRPIAGYYVVSVDFAELPRVTNVAAGKPGVYVSAVGLVTAPADTIYITTFVRGPAVASQRDAEAPDAAISTLRAKLAALGIRSEDITETAQILRVPGPPGPVPVARPTPLATAAPMPPPPAAFASFHTIRITIGASRDLSPIVTAIRETPGTSGEALHYALRERETAFQEAIARAVRDARTRAQAAAAAAGVRLGTLEQLTVDPDVADPPPTASAFGPMTVVDTERRPPITVRARVTVTYLIVR